MNKKIIKYLIWTIIIAALLILMPAKETKATTKVYYDDFKKSKSLFCLNKGYRFHSFEEFTVSNITGNGVNDEDIDFEFQFGTKVDKDVLKYIILESRKGAYGNRTNVSDYVPQIAIWKLAGSRDGDFENYDADSLKKADELIAKAIAYAEFVEAGSPVPTIEKYGADRIAIKYYRFTGTCNGVQGIYTNLLSTSDVKGAWLEKTENLGNGLYQHIYVKEEEGVAEVEVNLQYEIRSADLSYYVSIMPEPEYITEITTSSKKNWGDPPYCIIKNGNYICGECNLDRMYKLNAGDSVEPILKGLNFAGKDEFIYNIEQFANQEKNIRYCDKHLWFIDIGKNEDGSDDVLYYINNNGVTVNDNLIRWSYEKSEKPQDLLYGMGDITVSTIEETIKFIQPVTLNFNKEDFSGKSVAGATINITNVDNVDTLSANSITIGSGSVTVTPKEGSSGTFTIKLTENAPTGYQGIPETTLTVSYVDGKVTGITENSDYITTSGSTVTIKNKPQIEKLTLLKLDSQDSNIKLEGAKFTITLENVESIGNYHVGDNLDGKDNGKIIITGIKTDKDGELYIEDLVIKDESEDVKITIEETSSIVGYKKINGKITITLKRDGTSYTKHISDKDLSILDTEFVNGDIEVNNHQIALTIKNIPVMNLGGIVWEDAQSGDKVVAGPDGKYNNNEQGMAGIKVELYKADGTLVTEDAYGNNLMTKTSSGGSLNYELYKGGTSSIALTKGQYVFPNIEKGDYYVRFTYDGINYKTVSISSNVYENNNESKVSEIGRTAFNKKFSTVSAGQETLSAKAGNINLEYNESTQGDSKIKTSNLITRDSNGKILSKYEMKAQNDTCLKSDADWKTECWTDEGKIKNSYTQDINCGLTYRKFDLAIGMDIDSAKLTINGKDTTYNYNQIIDSGLTNPDNDLTLDRWLDGNISAETEKPIYNLYLYTSDYNYRIDDYKTDLVFNAGVTAAEDSSKIDDSETDTNKELRAFITYKVILKNQTTQTAQVNELAYYYDENYIFVSATDAKGKTITFANDANLPQINGKTSARVSGFASDLGENSNYRQELYFTFEVKKDADRFVTKDIECANLVEIISYTTKQGLIDRDSVPGNMVSNGSIRFEDDTDQAKGIKLLLETKATRTITGTVFEDTKTGEGLKYNGQKDDSEQGINNVIVQLIEIKNIGGQYYEYIWQETRSGSNTVKKLSEDGNSVQEVIYRETAPNDGSYVFNDFIPGNYIIRFIYGDGKTYNITSEKYKNSADSVKKYNGQDYKSTIDPNYKSSWYNTAGYVAGDSVARDNEARRLEVMAYSTIIDGAKGIELANKTTETLEKTWMCAETSRINIPVDADNKATSSDSTSASYDYTARKNKVLFGDMNFGLALRPQTKLTLEKHITALKITPNGTGVQSIIDASKDIEAYYDENTGNDMPKGITQGLATIPATRDNRGFWQVATDVEELMQGADLEVEYTYVLKNDGETDYLSNTLVEAYKNQDITMKSYNTVLTEIKDTVKGTMKNGTYSYSKKSEDNIIGTYLGQYYYTETKGNADEIVSSRVEIFEEALNNDIGFNSAETTSFKKVNVEAVDKTVYNVAGESKTQKIDTLVQNTSASAFLTPGSKDYTKTIALRKTLSTVSGGEFGANLPSYIAEITQYSNAAGRKDMTATPANLGYVHSDDDGMTLDTYKDGNIYYQIKDGIIYKLDATNQTDYEKTDLTQIPDSAVKINENDEFWGESIIITEPTGEDKQTIMQIAIITVTSIAVLGVGILLIKKTVLKK